MPNVAFQSKLNVPSDPGGDASATSSKLRLFWICLALGLLGLIILVWLFGLAWWSALIAVLIIACPAMAAWIIMGGLDRWLKLPGNEK